MLSTFLYNIFFKGETMDTNNDYVIVIGGVNIDIVGYPYSKLISQDSNIGGVKLSLGGVGRNIAKKIPKILLENFQETDFYLDTVSTAKAVKVRENLGKIHTLKTNRLESEALKGITIKDEDDLIKKIMI